MFDQQLTSKPGMRVEYVRILTLNDAKQFFGPISHDERVWRQTIYFDDLLRSPRARLGIGQHDRGEAFMFSNGDLPMIDAPGHTNHFPISVKVATIDELFVPEGETVDLSAVKEEFPWVIGEAEVYLKLTVNKLVLGRQSTVSIKGNVLIFTCHNVVGNGIGDHYATLEVGGAEAPQQSMASRRLRTSANAIHGNRGRDGLPLARESTPLGCRVGVPTSVSLGEDGTNGLHGNPGSFGANGAMLFHSDLRFEGIEGFQNGHLKLIAGAAHGFPGGDGSTGGNGGSGGNGADGLATPFGIARGCRGGNGGNGGNGGDGGKGGNGGLACDVFVSAPAKDFHVFHVETYPAAGGVGGAGGKAGIRGVAGVPGAFYEASDRAAPAIDGKDGSIGHPGRCGKERPAPNVHIYKRP
jgi:hypothetical protein